ncbi:MAG: sigma-70 family RNA polymerase sigma factor [Deltaproteobacteria bacterium]|nr:sigma-70 family RNA polymerase sigma factor [Deltaproteobacteria bacterium]
MEDFELLAAWRRGDNDAGTQLFERHYAAVVRFVKNKVANPTELEDVVQQIFLACVEGRDRFEQRSSFRTYLFGVAHFSLLDHFRRRRRDGAAIDASVTSVADLEPSPSLIVARREEQRLVVEGLRQLPLDYQVVLELFYWERLTGPEIADALTIPEGTVRFRIRRGKELLGQTVRRMQLVGPSHDGDGDLEAWVRAVRQTLPADGDQRGA